MNHRFVNDGVAPVPLGNSTYACICGVTGTREDVERHLAERHLADVKAIEEAPRSPRLRLRMKIWTDHETQKRYLMPAAIMTDSLLGTLTAYAMTDEDTRVVQLSSEEWNTLPFYYFEEDGPAPRPTTKRSVDVVSPGKDRRKRSPS